MKTFKVAVFTLMTAFASLSAQAKVWNNVEVVLAGTSTSGEIFLKLNSVTGDSTFTSRLFKLDKKNENVGLAIGMAAVSSNRQVQIYSNIDELDNSTYPTIDAIYLTKEIVINN